MAKPKSPLLSLGARGSIGGTLTFQKKGRATIARQKPIPTDPKTDLQLAQRQVYREAVAAWNALTPEEKEAWRGVCPGLTPYPCFMRFKIRELLVPPPPEEQTEEQTEHDSEIALAIDYQDWGGQRLTIPNREVTKLALVLRKEGSPTGPVTLQIRKVIGDQLIVEKLWGQAEDLPGAFTLEEVTFDTPAVVNEEVRIVAYSPGHTYNNDVRVAILLEDVKPDEMATICKNTTWTDYPDYDAAYRYKYYEVE